MLKLFATLLFVGFVFSAQAADTDVVQAKNEFNTDEVTIRTGDTVTFKNKDEKAHNLQIVNSEGDAEDKGLQRPGQDLQVTFQRAGTYKVRSTDDPGMQMTVTVK